MPAPTVFVNTWSGTLTANTLFQLVSATKWNYLRITSTCATGNLYVTTDGVVNTVTPALTGNTAPAAGADGGWTALPGETIIVATRQPIWYQGFGGPAGNINGVGLNNYRNYDPIQNIDGQAPNPGAGVSINTILGATSPGVIVEGAG